MPDPLRLFASILISVIGLGLFMYGRKQERLPQLAVGVLFMVYPFFVSNALVMGAIALVMLAGLWLAVRQGL